jgi:hypothetical protein
MYDCQNYDLSWPRWHASAKVHNATVSRLLMNGFSQFAAAAD